MDKKKRKSTVATSRKKVKQLTTWQYDSKFEKELCEGVMKGVDYHLDKLVYEVNKICTYTPDFTVYCTDDRYTKNYIEAKGRFHDRNEANKYLYVRDSLPEKSELIFLFQNPTLSFPGAQTRKDGTKMSHAEWAEKNGFRWFNKETIKELFNAK